MPPAERVATFDQDGTLWVEQPMYSQVIYCLDRVPAVVEAKPDCAKVEPFKTVMSGNREAIAKLSEQDLFKILAATLTGMSVETFNAEAKKSDRDREGSTLEAAVCGAPYLPMQEVLKYLRDNGYRTYIVTGGGRTSCACIRKPRTAFRPNRWSEPQAVPSTATTRTANRS